MPLEFSSAVRSVILSNARLFQKPRASSKLCRAAPSTKLAILAFQPSSSPNGDQSMRAAVMRDSENRHRRNARSDSRPRRSARQDAGVRHLRFRPARAQARQAVRRQRTRRHGHGHRPRRRNGSRVLRRDSRLRSANDAHACRSVPACVRSRCCCATARPMSVGYSNDVPGGYAERMVLMEGLLLPVPNGLSDRTRRADGADGGGFARRRDGEADQRRRAAGDRLRADRSRGDQRAEGARRAPDHRGRLFADATQTRGTTRRRHRARSGEDVAVLELARGRRRHA